MENVQADTRMRQSLSEEDGRPGGTIR